MCLHSPLHSPVPSPIPNPDANVPNVIALVALAKAFGVRTASYESGPAYPVGRLPPGSRALDTMIQAARDEGMQGVVVQHIRSCWAWGWDIYNYFSVEGEVSRYGCWGAAEGWRAEDRIPGSAKLRAIYNITGTDPSAAEAWAKGNRPRSIDPKLSP